jgi:hypothetical protein
MNRYLGALFLGVCLSSTALVGCGDDSESEGEDGGTKKNEATVNEAQAATAVASSTRAISSLGTGDGFAAATQMYAAAGAGLLILDYGAGAQQASIPNDDIAIAASALCEEQCSVTGDSGRCDFSDCDVSGAYFIDGFVEWDASSFSSDLTFAIETAAQGTSVSFTYHLVSDITYTATSIDGTVSLDGESSSGGQTATYDVDIDYNAVVFPEGGGCPTSGSVSVSASFGVSGQSYEASGDVTFPVDGCTG